MKKKEYMQPIVSIVAIKGDALMGDEWWSVGVDTEEEIEDDDIGAKQGNLSSDNWGNIGYTPWDD